LDSTWPQATPQFDGTVQVLNWAQHRCCQRLNTAQQQHCWQQQPTYDLQLLAAAANLQAQKPNSTSR
jgi:hypothetical protein